MPTYELKCPECGHEKEVIQSFQAPLPECPECKKEKMARLISRTSFKLRGGGWAQDGYCSVTPTYREAMRKAKDAVSLHQPPKKNLGARPK